MELQLKYHKNIWDKFLLGDLHIFKVTGWPSFQLTLLRPVCLNQNNHMTREQQLLFHKVTGNLAGMCHHHVRGTAANPLTSRSRSGNMLKSCTMKIPQWLQWGTHGDSRTQHEECERKHRLIAFVFLICLHPWLERSSPTMLSLPYRWLSRQEDWDGTRKDNPGERTLTSDPGRISFKSFF